MSPSPGRDPASVALSLTSPVNVKCSRDMFRCRRDGIYGSLNVAKRRVGKTLIMLYRLQNACILTICILYSYNIHMFFRRYNSVTISVTRNLLMFSSAAILP